MNKANECTCPSGDGSLVHPCPAHPAVEQAGGDERAVDGKPRATKCPDCGEGDLMPGYLCACGYETDPAAGYACSECDGSGDGYVGEVCRECDGSGWFVTPEQARAALAQPSGEVVVTKNESGAIVSVTRQDKEGRVLSVIAESATLTAQAEKAEVERPEVVAWQYRVTAGPQTGWSLWHPGKGEEFERSYTVERRPLMTVAQHERIVGELRAVIAQLRQHKNDYMDSGQETYRALQNEIREREAEIARLDGLVSGRTAERDAALARVEQQERTIAGMNEAHAKLADLYEAAQTQHSVPVAREQLERLVRILDAHNYAKDAEALMALLAAAPAQAQHSVPEGLALIPVRETEAMHDAVMALLYKGVARTDTQKLLDAYIAAAPQPAGGE
ncbi:hypothetical protein [Pseudomonas aeruginosa]|uniref:hypothetical protein n=1 Tax=Pseudomonas aeruginosa TaxID=287 RepID=UPI00249F16A7|nr:hypothetical protein [Pseudomonas aeruginosa]WGY37638.1 hypothetical protein LGV63_34085 [Pseudomonas aeruginosa]